MTAEKNRLKQAPEIVANDIKEHIKFLQNQLKKINSDINKHISLHKDSQKILKIIKSVPGIGPVTSACIIVELPELGHLNHKKIAALAGLAPFNRDSGKFRGSKSIWGGRAESCLKLEKRKKLLSLSVCANSSLSWGAMVKKQELFKP